MPTEFTPIASSLGGLMIGLAAGLLLLGTGRVAGISGILGGALRRDPGDMGWRVAFLLGLPLGAALVAVARGGLEVHVAASAPLLVIGGLLVGFGTRLGNGCTSGHGVCGVARGAPRSIVATLVFIAVAAACVFVTRHVIGATS